MLEELPTLSKLQIHKPHVYDADWVCCRCNIEDETFNHIWLCPSSFADIHDIINYAQHILNESIAAVNTRSPLFTPVDFSSDTLWRLPLHNQHNMHTHFFFIDLIKGLIPQTLVSSLMSRGLTHGQVVSILRRLLDFIQHTSWDVIWLTRCDIFNKFLNDRGITPDIQRSSPPSGFVRQSVSTRSSVSTSIDLLPQSMIKVINFLSYGKSYPFRWCINRLFCYIRYC
jgi:hypothetical protein